jgi:alkylation response protein AidB-like acyl-CoA dehydrogenase
MSDFTAEHDGLRDAVRGLLAKRSDSSAVRKAVRTPRGYDESLWRVLCEQIGVAGLSVPEQYGGAGATLLETHIVQDELGRALTPSPLLGSGVLAAQLLLHLGDEAACARLLPGIAAGSTVASVCWAGTDGDWRPDRTSVRLDGGLLHGTCSYVLDGDSADVLLAVADDDGAPAVFEVVPDQDTVVRAHTPTMDETRRLAQVRFAGARGTRLGGEAGAALRRALDAACVALSGEQVGAASRILELTVEYSKMRVQFGRPIGSFQALKHRMADLYVLVETARSTSYAAVDATVDPAVAKSYCSDAFFTVAAEAIQLHGGIAITWEHDAHLYFKRAHSTAQLFGPPDEHLHRLAPLAGIEEPT